MPAITLLRLLRTWERRCGPSALLFGCLMVALLASACGQQAPQTTPLTQAQAVDTFRAARAQLDNALSRFMEDTGQGALRTAPSFAPESSALTSALSAFQSVMVSAHWPAVAEKAASALAADATRLSADMSALRAGTPPAGLLNRDTAILVHDIAAMDAALGVGPSPPS